MCQFTYVHAVHCWHVDSIVFYYVPSGPDLLIIITQDLYLGNFMSAVIAICVNRTTNVRRPEFAVSGSTRHISVCADIRDYVVSQNKFPVVKLFKQCFSCRHCAVGFLTTLYFYERRPGFGVSIFNKSKL